jgi:hypothetical protein
VVTAMKKAHPYETVAYYYFPVNYGWWHFTSFRERNFDKGEWTFSMNSERDGLNLV